MDQLGAVHESLINDLRDVHDLLSSGHGVNDLEALAKRINRIRDKGQPSRHKLYEEAAATVASARNFAAQQYLDISEFARSICFYFERDRIYRHQLEHVCTFLAAALHYENHVFDHSQKRIVPSFDEVLNLEIAGISTAIDDYKNLYRDTCKKYAALKSKYLIP
jgi:hypothetical protein